MTTYQTRRSPAATGLRDRRFNNTSASHSTFAIDPVQLLLGRVDGVIKTGKGWRARCPAHGGKSASLSIAELRSGRLPLEYDTPARCTHCGPVWLPAATVDGLDAADGLPLVHGCPWCFVTLPKGMGIPRPIYPNRANAHSTKGAHHD